MSSRWPGRALLTACSALLATISPAQPAWKPERTVEIVVGSAAGGGNDHNLLVELGLGK